MPLLLVHEQANFAILHVGRSKVMCHRPVSRKGRAKSWQPYPWGLYFFTVAFC